MQQRLQKVIRELLESGKDRGVVSDETLKKSVIELNKISHRLYTDTNLLEPAKKILFSMSENKLRVIM